MELRNVRLCGCCARVAAIALVGIASSMVGGQTRRGREMSAKSCRVFVQEFYDWYSKPVKFRSGRPDRDRYDEDVLRERPDVLDKSLYRLLKSDRDCIKRTKGICNLDFDPFYNSQDPSQKYLVKEVHLAGARCTAPMMEMNDGEMDKPTRVQPELERRSGRWVFVNFDYFYPDDAHMKPTDLRSILADEPK